MDNQSSEHQKHHPFDEERERFQRNVEVARNLSKEVMDLTRQLNLLFEEIEASKNYSRALRMRLNQTAVKMGLSPISHKR